MDTMTLSFLVIGGLGALILLLGVVVGEFGGAHADGPFAVRAIAAFFGGGGFGGVAAASVVDRPGSYALRLGSGVVGALGTVVTGIGIGIGQSGYGEVRVAVGGHMQEFNARSQKPPPVGTPIYVVDIPIVQKLHVIDLSTSEVLAGALRSIVGRLTIEEIIRNRAAFAAAVAEEVRHR